MTDTTTLLISPRRPALVSGFDNTVDLLVRLQAPTAPAGAAERSAAERSALRALSEQVVIDAGEL